LTPSWSSFVIFVVEILGVTYVAHVATMRKLTRMLYHMLKTREHWKWENPQLTERKLAGLRMGGGDRS
jgi:hypothetical protein